MTTRQTNTVTMVLTLLLQLLAFSSTVNAFVVPSSPTLKATSTATTVTRVSSSTETSGETSSALPEDEEMIFNPNVKPSSDWELDCYSRPVVVAGGKKLWEVLITDSTGSFRYKKVLPSNAVNSKAVRQTVEELIENTPQLEVKPTTIRFFRGAMFNMINIALKELDVVGRPSRCTFALSTWLEERHRDVYPKMDGYVYYIVCVIECLKLLTSPRGSVYIPLIFSSLYETN